jgi:uncharacterized protein
MDASALAAELVPMPGEKSGARMVVTHRPAGTPRATVLYVHPFAEEMNKSRRMAALQARALCAAGLTVCLPDLRGCGDSSGDFGDAAWEDWIADIANLGVWARAIGNGPLIVWGLRAGCLIAAEAARRLDPAPALLFWQPTPSGRTVLQQFLRLKLAADMQASSSKGLIEAMRGQLERGDSVAVAGYTLAPALASGLEAATLEPVGRGTPVAWIEVASLPGAELLPASVAAAKRWRDAGHRVEAAVVPGTPFWNSVEIEEVPHLLQATVAAVEGLLPC